MHLRQSRIPAPRGKALCSVRSCSFPKNGAPAGRHEALAWTTSVNYDPPHAPKTPVERLESTYVTGGKIPRAEA